MADLARNPNVLLGLAVALFAFSAGIGKAQWDAEAQIQDSLDRVSLLESQQRTLVAEMARSGNRLSGPERTEEHSRIMAEMTRVEEAAVELEERITALQKRVRLLKIAYGSIFFLATSVMVLAIRGFGPALRRLNERSWRFPG